MSPHLATARSLESDCPERRGGERTSAACAASLHDFAAAEKPAVLVYRSALLPRSETFIREQILACRHWRAILVGLRRLDELALDGLEIALLDSPKNRFHNWLRPGLKSLRRARPRLMHAHFGPEAVAAAPLARSLGVPILVTLHGYDINIRRDWWESGEDGPAMRRYPGALVKLGQQRDVHFIAVSRAVRDRAIAYGIAPEKVTTCYIGIDTARFAPGPVPLAERPPRITFVGRLVEKKGCDILLRAMTTVRRRVPQAELAIIGDGPLRGALERLARQLGGGAQFLGALPSGQVKAVLDQSRIFCLPSIRAANGDAEGFGLALLEAQAAGLPVVSSALGGAREGILDGETGFRFEEGDTAMLAQRLGALLADPGKTAAMGQAARAFAVSRFDIQTRTAALEQLYDRMAGIDRGDTQT